MMFLGALGSIDPGSNPGSPILFIPFRVELTLFTELHVENCVVSCFKWFSNVLLRLKPNSLDFSTRSLSKYNTTLPLIPIAFAPARERMEVHCYKFGHLALFLSFSFFLYNFYIGKNEKIISKCQDLQYWNLE